MAYYKSFGAAGEVTGSCHLLNIGNTKILIDCGMFQGAEEHLNFEEFPFDPKEIDYLILTHAHLDHIGRVPLLVKKGFNKKIICTKATATIAKLMLENSAGILETKKNVLYTKDDIEPTFKLFNTYLESNKSMNLDENIKISFKNAGHILGAISVKIEFFDEGVEKSVIFSGDIGQKNRIITSDIEYWDKGNYLFVESTYGASIHQDLSISVENFKEKILKTLHDGGSVIIPSFALERTQEILYILNNMSNEGKLKGYQVYLDSPLAINVTKAFENFPELFSNDVKQSIKSGDKPFQFKELIQTISKEESQQINSNTNPKIIIAGSGMCEGGRVGYHLIRHLSNPKDLILFVGFQVSTTLGHKIISGSTHVDINEINTKIEAKIDYINGFSAHADQKQILEWINNIQELYCVYLVHGEQKPLEVLKEKIKDELKEKVHIVKFGEMIHI